MTAGRSVGSRIRQLCEALEEHGPLGVGSLRDLMPDVERSNVGKYCSRAVGLGLLTVDRGLGTTTNYSVWTVVPKWRELVDSRRTTRISPDSQPAKRSRWHGISNIFQMGAM